MDNEHTQPIENDGTLASAASLMPDIDQLEITNGDRDAARDDGRDDQGRFAKAQEEAGQDAEEVEAKDDAEPEAKADDAGAEEDDEAFIEITPEEEGAEPVRLKVDEVYEGYQRAKQLEAELENVKTTLAAPA